MAYIIKGKIGKTTYYGIRKKFRTLSSTRKKIRESKDFIKKHKIKKVRPIKFSEFKKIKRTKL